ncbi:hypothetical protein D3C71_1000840 [compost metagenome]
MNKRLNVMTTLGELLSMHIADYERGRAGRAPKLSIHGKQQNIKMQFQIHERVVGELVLVCPKNDPDPENYVGRFGNWDVTLPETEDWAHAIRKLPHAKRQEQRDYWAAMDILYMMALVGFKVVTFDGKNSHIHAAGVLAPGGGEGYGRFHFNFNVTTASDSHRNFYGQHGGAMPVLPDHLKTDEDRRAELSAALQDPSMEVVRVVPGVEAIHTIRGRETGEVTFGAMDQVTPEEAVQIQQAIATGGSYEGTKNESI